ncbi:LacI family DNA-binding transcriptional regulator [Microbulbifer thermotolerans]|uniref:HTH lacI-type domain-containing protein n=1 Tax=Microbulbifer thermotolerans TaxID=252514 RepID=A0A143HKB8_MICTH|nr:LacI family DNA-binding transcriptional regulator [Microbulbifer thermotolerans]AMX02113.1 hypothetical protein A3224_05525 [Microbulbifer thermotolerans]
MSSIKDVAELAGVSVKTVSRILNGFEGVSERTRAKVQEAMDRLEYYPSAAAQSLRGKETGLVSLITDHLTTTPDAFEIVAGIQSVCEKRGKLLLIGETGGSQESFQKLVEDFRRQRAQAIIFATMYHRKVEIKQSFERCPLILLNCFDTDSRYPCIIPDDEQGGFDATEHLLAQGHKRIAFLTLFEHMPATSLRVRGHLRALEKHGIEVDPNLITEGVFDDSQDEFAGLEALLKELLKGPKAPTAILCGNDKMAMRVYMHAIQLGYRIPDELSIVGYDNYRMIAENLVPKLTTVSLPYFQMGELAAELAIDGPAEKEKGKRNKRKNNHTIKIGGDLIVRGSTGFQ